MYEHFRQLVEAYSAWSSEQMQDEKNVFLRLS